MTEDIRREHHVWADIRAASAGAWVDASDDRCLDFGKLARHGVA